MVVPDQAALAVLAGDDGRRGGRATLFRRRWGGGRVHSIVRVENSVLSWQRKCRRHDQRKWQQYQIRPGRVALPSTRGETSSESMKHHHRTMERLSKLLTLPPGAWINSSTMQYRTRAAFLNGLDILSALNTRKSSVAPARIPSTPPNPCLVMDIDNLPGSEGLYAEEVFTNREHDCYCSRPPAPFLDLVTHIIPV